MRGVIGGRETEKARRESGGKGMFSKNRRKGARHDGTFWRKRPAEGKGRVDPKNSKGQSKEGETSTTGEQSIAAGEGKAGSTVDGKGERLVGRGRRKSADARHVPPKSCEVGANCEERGAGFEIKTVSTAKQGEKGGRDRETKGKKMM